jgi:ribonuclease III
MQEFSHHYALTFRDPSLLKLALTHRSYLHVTGQRDSNERLEFLGDSVLGLVTSEFLYRTHPSEHEGQLTKTKSLLVSKAILSRRALAMGLGRFVLMSHSEVESGGRQRLSILADAFESVVGAIYLDQGFEAGRAFIERWLLRDTRSIVADKRHTNYKSHLQEYVQSTYRTHPVYRIRSEMGPDHSKQFMVEVIVGKRTLGDGKGRNKKEAEQAAARNALERVERGPVSDRGSRPTEEREARPLRAERGRPAPVVEDADDESIPMDDMGDQPDEAGEAGEAGEEPRKRRRGRRGGRGRRRPGEPRGTTSEAEETTTEPERHAEPPTRHAEPPARRAEPAARRAEPAARPSIDRPREVAAPEERAVELEPMPRLFEEDENEEVGRPEGPREESHVDPYAWGGTDLRSSAIFPSQAPPPPVARQPEPVDSEDDDIEPAEAPAESPPRASESTPPSAPAVFGRRRSRR